MLPGTGGYSAPARQRPTDGSQQHDPASTRDTSAADALVPASGSSVPGLVGGMHVQAVQPVHSGQEVVTVLPAGNNDKGNDCAQLLAGMKRRVQIIGSDAVVDVEAKYAALVADVKELLEELRVRQQQPAGEGRFDQHDDRWQARWQDRLIDRFRTGRLFIDLGLRVAQSRAALFAAIVELFCILRTTMPDDGAERHNYPPSHTPFEEISNAFFDEYRSTINRRLDTLQKAARTCLTKHGWEAALQQARPPRSSHSSSSDNAHQLAPSAHHPEDTPAGGALHACLSAALPASGTAGLSLSFDSGPFPEPAA